MPRLNSPAELERLREEIRSKRDPNKLCIGLCSSTGCQAAGSENVSPALQEEIQKQGLAEKIDFRKTGCLGLCGRGPLVAILPSGICYCNVRPEDAEEIISVTAKGEVVERLLYAAPITPARSGEDHGKGPRAFGIAGRRHALYSARA